MIGGTGIEHTDSSSNGFDRARANAALDRYDYEKHPPLDEEGQMALREVIKIAKEKVNVIVNAHPAIRRDFEVFRPWLERNESQLLRGSYKTWIGSTILVRGPEQAATVTGDDRLLVSPAMSSMIQWRFVVLDAGHSLDTLGKGGNEGRKTFRERFKLLSRLLKEPEAAVDSHKQSDQPSTPNGKVRYEDAQPKP